MSVIDAWACHLDYTWYNVVRNNLVRSTSAYTYYTWLLVIIFQLMMHSLVACATWNTLMTEHAWMYQLLLPPYQDGNEFCCGIYSCILKPRTEFVLGIVILSQSSWNCSMLSNSPDSIVCRRICKVYCQWLSMQLLPGDQQHVCAIEITPVEKQSVLQGFASHQFI